MTRTSSIQLSRGIRRSSWIVLAALTVLIGAGVTSANAGTTRPDAQAGLPAAKVARLRAETLGVQPKSPLVVGAAVQKPSKAQGLAHAKSLDSTANGTDTGGLTPGILDMRQGPFPAAQFTVRNIYRGHVGTSWLFVFAGTENSDSSGAPESAVRIYQLPDSGSFGYVGVYRAPSNVGALHVVGVSGTVLQLASDNGQAFTFDLATLAFG